jgi:predicted RNA-binding protein with PIN domain
MRYLIDGYNLMYAGGLLGKRFGPDGFRKVRARFLNELADTLGPVDASQTTVVFDASAAPEHVPRTMPHKGLTVIFAVDNENADERIEQLIAAHSTPKTLTVISSDRRIRQAASRRKSRAVTADDFWVELDSRKRLHFRGPAPAPTLRSPPVDPALSAEEAAYWLREFGNLDDRPETRQALNGDRPVLTDEEIAEIERQIEREPG